MRPVEPKPELADRTAGAAGRALGLTAGRLMPRLKPGMTRLAGVALPVVLARPTVAERVRVWLGANLTVVVPEKGAQLEAHVGPQ